MEQARIEHAPNGSLLTYITSANATVTNYTSIDERHPWLFHLKDPHFRLKQQLLLIFSQ